MTGLLHFAGEVQAFCRSRDWRFCVIGGVAVQRWGETRLTTDVDLTLLTGFGSEEIFADAFLARYQPRIPDARSFALERRVLLLRSDQGIGLDVALGGLPFEEGAVERASDFEFLPGLFLRTCSAEDLVVFKAFAGRPLDWQDVKTILVRQRGKLNLALVRRELTPLVELKEEPEILKRLETLVAETA
ncbi:MAG: hypothetical protein ACOYMV_12045 [Verrucomicrobiia bacterium]